VSTVGVKIEEILTVQPTKSIIVVMIMIFILVGIKYQYNKRF